MFTEVTFVTAMVNKTPLYHTNYQSCMHPMANQVHWNRTVISDNRGLMKKYNFSQKFIIFPERITPKCRMLPITVFNLKSSGALHFFFFIK